MRTQTKDGKLNLWVPKQRYSEAVIYKCLYWYTKRYEVVITDCDFEWDIALATVEEDDMLSLIADLKLDLIDYQLRQIVANETHQVRELIIAKAFAYEDISDGPSTSVSDPVGFDVNAIE